MYKFANTLLTKLAACEHVTVTESDYDDDIYVVEVDLGTGWAGDYAPADWGGWGDVSITDDRLQLHVLVMGGDNNWDDEQDYCFGEGTVALHYKDFETAGLAYTSKLEDAINEAIEKRTNGLLLTSGSEQGMQGMDDADSCYLSLDVDDTVEEPTAQTVTA